MKFFSSTLIIFTFLAGGSVALFGFIQMHRLESYQASWSNLELMLAVFSATVLCVFSISKLLKLNHYSIFVIIAIAIAVFTGNIWPLLVTVWILTAGYVVGSKLISFLKINGSRVDDFSILLVGLGVYATFIGLLAHLPVNYPGLYFLLLIVPTIAGRSLILEKVKVLKGLIGARSHSVVLDIIIVVFLLIHFWISLMPEIGHDALMMHLFVPGYLAHNHFWSFDVTNYAWAVMPMLGDWLFSFGYLLGGEVASRLINLSCIYMLCGFIRNLVIWAEGNEVGARWAILIFLSTPVAFLESNTLFIDLVWTAFIVAASFSIFRLSDSHCSRYGDMILIAGLLAGFACQTKAVSFMILPVLFLVLLLACQNWAKRSLIQSIVLGMALFFMFGSIPYLTAWIVSGNPVFPFFNKLFQSPFFYFTNFEAPGEFAGGFQWDFLYQVTFHSEKFIEGKPGAAGFQWLLLMIPSLLILLKAKSRKGIMLFTVALFSVALIFYQTTYLRYILPSFVWGSIGIGVSFSVNKTEYNPHRIFLQIFGCLVIILNLFFLRSATWYGNMSIKPLLSLQDRSEYLGKCRPIRNAVEFVNKINFNHSPVAIFSSPYAAGLNADAIYPLWYNFDFERKVREALDSEELLKLFLSYKVDFIIIDDDWPQIDKLGMIERFSKVLVQFENITVRAID